MSFWRVLFFIFIFAAAFHVFAAGVRTMRRPYSNKLEGFLTELGLKRKSFYQRWFV